MKDITFVNIIRKVKISFSPLFTPKIGDLAENVRVEGPKKQAIVFCSGPEKQAISLLEQRLITDTAAVQSGDMFDISC